MFIAALVALAVPAAAVGSDLSRDLKRLQADVRSLEKAHDELLSTSAKEVGKNRSRIIAVGARAKVNTAALKDVDEALGEAERTLRELLKLIAVVEDHTLARCAAMIERYGRITGQSQPRDIKDRLLRGFR